MSCNSSFRTCIYHFTSLFSSSYLIQIFFMINILSSSDRILDSVIINVGSENEKLKFYEVRSHISDLCESVIIMRYQV